SNGNGNNASSTTQATTTATTTEEVTEAPSEGYFVDSYGEQVLTIVNQVRAEQGLAPLTMNYTLLNAAHVRAKEIEISFSHTRPNGSSCFTAWSEAGVSYWTCGENIAAGYWTPQSVMDGWVASPGHYSNIINANFTEIAIGCYYDPNSTYGYYWVQCFK
ncbi:MAG: hypothetical protein IJX12_05400, partial [Lachnospiraceae bacterium]|nr:hypothetical protein [Lachnospiraceae bacterium]